VTCILENVQKRIKENVETYKNVTLIKKTSTNTNLRNVEINESALILSALENRLRAGLV